MAPTKVNQYNAVCHIKYSAIDKHLNPQGACGICDVGAGAASCQCNLPALKLLPHGTVAVTSAVWLLLGARIVSGCHALVLLQCVTCCDCSDSYECNMIVAVTIKAFMHLAWLFAIVDA